MCSRMWIDRTETSRCSHSLRVAGKEVVTEMLKTFIFSASVLGATLLGVRAGESVWAGENRFNSLNSKEIAILTILPTVAAASTGWKTAREKKKAERTP